MINHILDVLSQQYDLIFLMYLFFQSCGVECHPGDALKETAHTHPPLHPPPAPPPPIPNNTSPPVTCSVNSYSVNSGPGQNNNQLANQQALAENSDNSSSTMKSQNHSSVNSSSAVKGGVAGGGVGSVSRGQNNGSNNGNNKKQQAPPTNSDNCTMPKRPRKTSGPVIGGYGMPAKTSPNMDQPVSFTKDLNLFQN